MIKSSRPTLHTILIRVKSLASSVMSEIMENAMHTDIPSSPRLSQKPGEPGSGIQSGLGDQLGFGGVAISRRVLTSELAGSRECEY